MKIQVKKISQDGLLIDQTLPASDLDLPADVIDCLSPLRIRGIVEKAGAAVIAKVDVTGRYGYICGRCLEGFEQERTDHFNLIFEILPTTETIDLGEDIRQEMIILFSFPIFCKEDCQGICANCGANLNVEPCECTSAKGKKAKKQVQ